MTKEAWVVKWKLKPNNVWWWTDGYWYFVPEKIIDDNTMGGNMYYPLDGYIKCRDFHFEYEEWEVLEDCEVYREDKRTDRISVFLRGKEVKR